MSIAEKLQTIAENESKVFEAGKQAVYNALWNAIQNNGQREPYSYAFSYGGWKKSNFKPKYDIRPTGASQMFNAAFVYNEADQIDMEELEKECGIVFDFSNCTNMQLCFYTNLFKTINVVDLSNATQSTVYCFYGYNAPDPPLQRINKVIFSENTNIANNMFNYLRGLTEIRFDGVIASNGINLNWSTELSIESLRSLINALADKSADTSGTVWSVKVGSANLAKLTPDDEENIIKKGWNFT